MSESFRRPGVDQAELRPAGYAVANYADAILEHGGSYDVSDAIGVTVATWFYDEFRYSLERSTDGNIQNYVLAIDFPPTKQAMAFLQCSPAEGVYICDGNWEVINPEQSGAVSAQQMLHELETYPVKFAEIRDNHQTSKAFWELATDVLVSHPEVEAALKKLLTARNAEEYNELEASALEAMIQVNTGHNCAQREEVIRQWLIDHPDPS
jgi:hypothetical protein